MATNHQGLCPKPFLQENTYPSSGGFIPGRLCIPVAQLQNLTCCLPCPLTDWTYADGFNQRTEIANWVNLACFIMSLFLLLSFVALPVKWTHRHYLSVCLTIGVVFIELAFVIPLIGKPKQCFNDITPNDMHSSAQCAVSGAFLLFGGWAAVAWVFCRALALHLQICWEVVPGKIFFYSTLVLGWAVPGIGIAITLSLSGVSYRFGNVCHVNHQDALQDFWGPLLAIAAISLVLQFITLGYCIHVYVRSLLDDSTTTVSSGQGPEYSRSVTTITAKQAYRRVKRVIELQWRGASVVLLIIGEVVFFSVVFVSMDNSTQVNAELLAKAQPWIQCLFLSGGNKNTCLSLGSALVESEPVVLAVLIFLGLSGFWCLILLGRWSMVLGWKDMIQRYLFPNHEFVSADARRFSNDPRTYELLSGTTNQLKSPDPVVTSPGAMRNSPFSPASDSKQDYFAPARTYVSPISSYSVPRPPSAAGPGRDWDPRRSHAKAGVYPGQGYAK